MSNRRKSKLYIIWIGMKQRCNNPNNTNYKNYGAKGIRVCKEWDKSFDHFYNWALSIGYKENKNIKLTIDRIDNTKGYYPSNCRFLTLKEQQNNRTNNHLITYKGETHTVSQWSKILNINVQTLFTRISKNLSIEEIFSNKKLHKKEVINPAKDK